MNEGLKNYNRIIKEYRTPFYLYDEGLLVKRCSLIREKLPGIGICYAMKACPIIAAVMDKHTDRLEVCSPGEYEICHRAGIKPERILVSGVNKTRESMERIMELGGDRGFFTIESPKHFDILNEISQKFGKKLRCFIRLSGGNQFGSDQDTVFDLVKKVCDAAFLELSGIHFYAGTQKSLKKAEAELELLADFAKKLKSLYNIKTDLEYGPGLPVDYFNPAGTVISDVKDAFDKEAEQAAGLLDELHDILIKTGIGSAYENITFEYGRFMASCTGMYVTSVNDIKKNGDTFFCIVDGGIHQINYFGSMAGMKTPYVYVSDMNETDGSGYPDIDTDSERHAEDVKGPSEDTGEKELEYVIAGSLCSANDILIRRLETEKLKIGDRLVLCLAGAYALTEGAALFLSRDLPAVIGVFDEQVKVLRNHMEVNSINDGSLRIIW